MPKKKDEDKNKLQTLANPEDLANQTPAPAEDLANQTPASPEDLQTQTTATTTSTPTASPSPAPQQQGGQAAVFRDEAGRLSGIKTKEGQAFVGLPEEDIIAIAKAQGIDIEGVEQQQLQAQGEQRRADFQRETGSERLSSNLQNDILNPESLKPSFRGLLQQIELQGEENSQRDDLIKLFSGKLSEDEARTVVKNAAKGIAVGSAVSLAALSIPFVATAVAGLAIRGAVTAKLSSFGGSIAGLATLYIGGKGVFDVNGSEIDTFRNSLSKVVEDGERLEASVRNGQSPSEAIELLRQMSQEVDTAESEIKRLAQYNAQYRVSKEYITDQQKIRSARTAIFRRTLAVENIAATGQGVVDPEALLFQASKF